MYCESYTKKLFLKLVEKNIRESYVYHKNL